VKHFGAFLHAAGFWLAKVVPNLQVFVPPRPVLTGEAIDVRLAPYLGMAGITALGWAIGLLAAASFVFKKRDFL
jgi:hypothetical protein